MTKDELREELNGAQEYLDEQGVPWALTLWLDRETIALLRSLLAAEESVSIYRSCETPPPEAE